MALHCTVHCDDILKAVGAQQNITNKKGNMAILSNILLEAADNQLICTSTDLEIGLKLIIPAEVIEEGRITLPAKKLFELARESGGADITFKEQDNSWVEIEAGPSRYRLAGMNAEEFPQFPSYNQEALVSLDSEVLAEMIDKTSFSIALDKVTSSAYSKSPPIGRPCAIRVTFTPTGFKSFAIYIAVAAPSTFGFVAMIISFTSS